MAEGATRRPKNKCMRHTTHDMQADFRWKSVACDENLVNERTPTLFPDQADMPQGISGRSRCSPGRYGIVLLTITDFALSSPAVSRAVTAKYQVPCSRLSIW